MYCFLYSLLAEVPVTDGCVQQNRELECLTLTCFTLIVVKACDALGQIIGSLLIFGSLHIYIIKFSIMLLIFFHMKS